MTAPSTVIVLGNFLDNNCRQQLPTEATETNQRTLKSQLRYYAAGWDNLPVATEVAPNAAIRRRLQPRAMGRADVGRGRRANARSARQHRDRRGLLLVLD